MAQMALMSGITIDTTVINESIKRIINQVYKLLPMRQEGRDWEKLLETLIQELSGMKRLIVGQDDLFFLVLCKMEGLFSLKDRDDMHIYRRTIFEILNLLNSLNKCLS